MIGIPVAYCDEDQVLVSTFDARPLAEKDASYWSDADISQLKTRVKDYYISIQNTRCCYCNRHLGTTNHRDWDIEHVASRSKHPQFMFTPINLAVSCVDCNIEKGEKESLVNSKRKTYPSGADGFLIVHPHFDNFGDHVFYSNFVYVPKTKKGNATIRVCNLLRFAEKYIDWNNSALDTSFEAEVNAVFEERAIISEAAVEAIVAQLPPK